MIIFFENLWRKCSFHWKWTRKRGTLHEYQYTFLNITRSVLPRMKSVSDKCCRENRNTHFMFNNFFWCHLWDNVEYIVEPGRPQKTTRRMRIASWIPKSTNAHWEHVIHMIYHCNSSCTKAPQCYVIRTLPVLLGEILCWELCNTGNGPTVYF